MFGVSVKMITFASETRSEWYVQEGSRQHYASIIITDVVLVHSARCGQSRRPPWIFTAAAVNIFSGRRGYSRRPP